MDERVFLYDNGFSYFQTLLTTLSLILPCFNEACLRFLPPLCDISPYPSTCLFSTAYFLSIQNINGKNI